MKLFNLAAQQGKESLSVKLHGYLTDLIYVTSQFVCHYYDSVVRGEEVYMYGINITSIFVTHIKIFRDLIRKEMGGRNKDMLYICHSFYDFLVKTTKTWTYVPLECQKEKVEEAAS